ncbi:MAG: DUF2326 domain-containing protein [Rickettsiaceae bacterium]|nr:DUF2326 domain-containing protein [Rickettsiaceae bacterium]
MFLKSLTIKNDSNLVREILFKKGVNLIVDETKTVDRKKSGNNVGKTTVLRLIDFCLGSDGKNIYKDPEFKSKTNSQIEKFLKENNVIVTLILKEDLDIDNSREITIKRNFLAQKEKILEIDGQTIIAKDFFKKLKEKIFNSKIEKPSFRQIISKNIRDEKNRLVNTVKTLHPTSTNEEYEALYLFWLGIDLDVSDRKQRLLAEKKAEENIQKKLIKTTSLSQITQSLIVINRMIEDLQKKKKNLDVSQSYEENIQQLNTIKANINRLSTKLSGLELRKELIEESAETLNKELSNTDTEQIKRIYDEAKALIPNIQKTYEETLKFHNAMIVEKKKYITQELPDLRNEISREYEKLNNLLEKEKILSNSLKKSGTMEYIEEIIAQLSEAHENKGALEEQKRQWENNVEKLNSIDKELKEIDTGINALDGTIQSRVSEFNKIFADVSNKLYGKKFVLSADKNNKGYELNITSLMNNPGIGMKKGEMAAFDLSYVKFADAVGINCLHFILQDQIENIHDNQITSILTEIVESINCQYVLSVLRDKLPSNVNISKYEILSLSQNNKLFNI